MFPILQLGPVALRLPGLFLLIGVWVGTSFIDREAPRHKVSGEALNKVVLYGLIGGIVGARLAYALRYLHVYAEDPLALIALNPATLAPLEGAFAGAIAALAVGQKLRLPWWPSLDALTPTLAAFSVFVGLAHLSNGDAFGAASNLPWAIELWGAQRHPSQVYEIAIALLILLAVWRLRRTSAYPGFLFLSWLALAAGSRLFLEGFRGDSVIILGTLRSAQLSSLAVLVACLAALHLRARRELNVVEELGPPAKAD